MPVPFCTQDAEYPAQTAKNEYQCKAGQLHFRWFNALRKTEPQQKQNKQSALYSTADKASAVIEKRHEPAAAKAPGTDNGTDHGPGSALRKALVCHQVGQPGHAGGGEYPTNAECGQCFQDG
jgi:hypothetical protein